MAFFSPPPYSTVNPHASDYLTLVRVYASKLQMAVTFDSNVRLRPIICQNARNRRRNPWANIEGGIPGQIPKGD